MFHCTEYKLSALQAGISEENKLHVHGLATQEQGPKFWDKVDPSLHDSSQLTFKKQYRDVLISAYDDR